MYDMQRRLMGGSHRTVQIHTGLPVAPLPGGRSPNGDCRDPRLNNPLRSGSKHCRVTGGGGGGGGEDANFLTLLYLQTALSGNGGKRGMDDPNTMPDQSSI